MGGQNWAKAARQDTGTLPNMWYRRKLMKLFNRRIIFQKPPKCFQSSSETLTPINDSIQDGIEDRNGEIYLEETTSRIPIVELKNVLNVNKCQFKDGFTCFSVQCVNCGREKYGNIYVNKITGFCLCLDCQEVGDWIDFIPKIESIETRTSTTTTVKKKSRKLSIIAEYRDQWNNLKQNRRPIASLSDEEFERFSSLFGLKVMGERKILSDFDAVYDDTRQILCFPLSNGRKRIVGIKELAVNGHESCTPVKKCPGFLRYVPPKVIRKAEDVILVDSVKDLLALATVKHNYHVICLPHGSQALPQEILPLLEQYTKIVLWFGADKMSAARLFANKLKEERCYLVRVPGNPALFIENSGAEETINTLKTAHPMKNEYVTTFADLKDDVFFGITNTDQSQGVRWKRFPALNEILRGHRRGELTVLTGPTGSGKTTFLSEYSLDLAMQGVTTLWGSFEIRNQRLASTMLQQFAKEPLAENLNKFETWTQEFEKLPIYFLKFHGQQSIQLVMEVIEQAAYVHDIRHLVIDNLQFMLGLSTAEERYLDRFYKQDKVVATLRTFATVHDCHVTLIIHPRKEKDTEELSISSLFGTAKASQEADNIMIIQKKMLESLRFKKYLQIVKNRYSGDLGVMPLNFTKSALSFATKISKEKS